MTPAWHTTTTSSPRWASGQAAHGARGPGHERAPALAPGCHHAVGIDVEVGLAVADPELVPGEAVGLAGVQLAQVAVLRPVPSRRRCPPPRWLAVSMARASTLVYDAPAVASSPVPTSRSRRASAWRLPRGDSPVHPSWPPTTPSTLQIASPWRMRTTRVRSSDDGPNVLTPGGAPLPVVAGLTPAR